MLAPHPPACSDGRTPLNLAIDMNKLDVVALLRKVGAAAAVAAAARLAGKEPSDIIAAAKEGDVGRIADHLAVDPSRVNLRDG